MAAAMLRLPQPWRSSLHPQSTLQPMQEGQHAATDVKSGDFSFPPVRSGNGLGVPTQASSQCTQPQAWVAAGNTELMGNKGFPSPWAEQV